MAFIDFNDMLKQLQKIGDVRFSQSEMTERTWCSLELIKELHEKNGHRDIFFVRNEPKDALYEVWAKAEDLGFLKSN